MFGMEEPIEKKKNMGCKNARKGIVWSRGKMPKWFNK
jgi:hypothetical protein